MASAERISSSVLDDLIAQSNERKTPPPNVLEDLQHQKRLREGDYDLTTLPGMFKGAAGVAENIAQMMTGFASAVPGVAAGLGAAAGAKDWQAYPEAFAERAEKTTYAPRTIKGKKIQGAIEDTYNKYINEKWNEYLAENVEQGYISPAEATYYRASADALIMGVLMKGGKAAFGRRGPKPKEEIIDLDAKPVEGEYIPATEKIGGGRAAAGETIEGVVERPLIEQRKLLPAPEEAPLRIAVRQAIEDGRPKQEIFEVVKDAKSVEEAADAINKMERPSVDRVKRNPLEIKEMDEPLPTPNEARAKFLADTEARLIRQNKETGAIDPKVFAEGVAQLLRPGVRGAKVTADLAHALARQVAFKHVTDIRKINSPTAKMLADRIMPLETSEIPLGGGFHELISLKAGEYNQRIENILEPLRKHVVNKNAAKTARIVALPKKTNNAIFRALDTGKVPKSLAPAVRAIRAILNDLAKYQIEAGQQLEPRPNYFPHMWDAKKISRAEYGRKSGGKFVQYLMEREGLSFDAAMEAISNITHEEGFLDFIVDTGGRLQKGENFNTWARAHRVGGGPTKPSHLQQRKLKGNFDEAKEWLVTDIETILTNYVRRAVDRAEYTRIAGPGEGKLNQLVRQIIEEQQFHAQEGGKLKATSPHETAQEIYDVFDALQHRFHQITNPTVRRASRAVAGFEIMVHLGKVALAQFPETMMPAARYRVATTTKGGKIPIPLKSYVKGLMDSAINAMSHASVAVTGKRLIPKTEIRKHLERIGVILPSALQSSATRMAGPVGVLTNRFIRMVGMEAITNLQRTISLDTIQSMIRQNARYLAKGTAQGTKYKMYRQELIELGFEPDAVVEWYRAGMPKDSPIARKFDIAYVRGVDTNIILPKAANAPRLYNDPRWQLPVIFTRFFTVFGNTVLKNIGKKLLSAEVTTTRKVASIGSLVAAVGIAYYTQFLREVISGYQYRDEDDPMRIVDAVDRSGLTAMFTRLYPLFSAYKYGIGSKYIANVLGGPLGGDVAKFIEAAKGGNEQKARWMARMTPVLNITPTTEDEIYEFYLEMIETITD